MVVHFLLHGEDGRYADGLVRYIQAEVEGRAGPEVMYEALGTTAGELQEAFEVRDRPWQPLLGSQDASNAPG